MEELNGKNILILGYGQEGKSSEKYLKQKYPEKSIFVKDLLSEKLPIEDLLKYDTIVRSPGISPNNPLLIKFAHSGRRITSATNIFFAEFPGMIIGITGTKGKSTAASLIKSILSKKFPDVRLVGNIGIPALSELDTATKRTIFVMELSSYQLSDLHYSPHIAVILAIYPEHINYHGDFQNYIRAKTNIVRHQKSSDIVIFNSENQNSSKIALKSAAIKKIGFKSANNSHLLKNALLQGKGNLQNALAAITVGIELRIPLVEAQKVIKTFKPLPHRLAYVDKVKDIKFYNDSLATIPEATINALDALGNDVETLIAGGYDRGVDFIKLGNRIKKSQIKNLILFPETGKKIWQATENSKIRKYDVRTMKEAVEIALDNTKPGKICLLSPASASFNLYKDYKERGKLFINIVRHEKKIINKESRQE